MRTVDRIRRGLARLMLVVPVLASIAGSANGESFAYAYAATESNSVNEYDLISATAATNGIFSSAKAAAYIGPYYGGETIYLKSYAFAGDPEFSAATAISSWTDRVTIQSGAAPLPDHLVLNLSVSGYATSVAYAEAFLSILSAPDAALYLRVSDTVAISTSGGATFSGLGWHDGYFSGLMQVDVPLTGNNVDYSVQLTAQANVIGTSDFYHTVYLSQILLPDGNTPESEGYTLSFESGMLSPNLAASAVPEPGSLMLAGLGPVGFLIHGRRQRR